MKDYIYLSIRVTNAGQRKHIDWFGLVNSLQEDIIARNVNEMTKHSPGVFAPRTFRKKVKSYRQALLDEFDGEKSDESWGLLYTIYRYLKGE